jgi:hypothetical protein
MSQFDLGKYTETVHMHEEGSGHTGEEGGIQWTVTNQNQPLEQRPPS